MQYSILTSSILFLIMIHSACAQDADQLAWLIKGAPDPAAIRARDGSGNYVFATGEGIAIWHSASQTRWKRIGRVFEDAVPAWALKLIPKADSIWAPDIQFVNGSYYLYYSVSTFGSQRSVIGLAVNSTLDPEAADYQWEDRGLVIESFPEKNDYNAIDPAMFVDGDRGYLVWGSYWTGIKGTEIDLATGKPESSQPKAVALAARESTAPTAIEAAYVLKHDDFFYLFVSWDFCCAREKSTYKVLVGRSKSPLGPYVDDRGRKMTEGGGQLVLMSDDRWRGPGHNSVLQTDDGDFLVYHVISMLSPDEGRVLQLRPIKWKDGWPTVQFPVGVTLPSAITLHALYGRWQHTVNERDHYDIIMEPTGEITGTKGFAEWEFKGQQVLFKWHDPNAPGGMWVDHVHLSSDWLEYEGRNQNGTLIKGRRVIPGH